MCRERVHSRSASRTGPLSVGWCGAGKNEKTFAKSGGFAYETRAMGLERTLTIIKPDAVEKHKAGAILARFEEEGFVIKAMKRIHLTRAEAEGFYAEHKGRGFFDELVTFMSR